MVIKYTSIFHSKVHQNVPTLGFLACKYTIWQPWSVITITCRFLLKAGVVTRIRILVTTVCITHLMYYLNTCSSPYSDRLALNSFPTWAYLLLTELPQRWPWPEPWLEWSGAVPAPAAATWPPRHWPRRRRSFTVTAPATTAGPLKSPRPVLN
jgi:hypothetical protein